MIQYLTLEDFVKDGFPFIQQVLAVHEPVPDYLSEANGMAELRKVFSFVQQDEYYPAFAEKAAYILCSIAGSQYFSNGNKRLAVTVLMFFFMKNNIKIPHRNEHNEVYRVILKIAFPLHSWEENEHIHDAHPLFLYNLAIVIGDRSRWGVESFSAVREVIAMAFDCLYSQGH